jgi:two-component system, OmpR family, phosphate regulon sensor histidine kinase PhoR
MQRYYRAKQINAVGRTTPHQWRVTTVRLPLPSPAAPSLAPATAQAPPSSDPAEQVMGLLKVSSYLVSMLDPDELLANLLAGVTDALPFVEAGILWSYDRSAGRLRVTSLHGLPLSLELLGDLYAAHLRPGEALAGLALQRGEPQYHQAQHGYRETADYLSPANQLLFHQVSDQLPRQLTSVCLPLRVGSEISGVLELIDMGCPEDRPGCRALSPADIPVLQTFGNLAATAIKNAQLYAQAEAAQQRLKAFDAVVTAISTAADLDDLMRSVLDVVVGLLPDSCGALLLLDREHNQFILGAARDLSRNAMQALRSMPLAGSACEEVVYYGQPVFRPLLAERGEGAMLAAGLESAAYLPLLAGGTVAGVLMLFGGPNLYRSVDQATIMPICNQVGFAIANVRLYNDSISERRKLNTVVSSIAEGVILCDSRGRLLLYNNAAQNLLRIDLPFEQPLSDMADYYRFRDLDGSPLPIDRLPMAMALSGEVFPDYRVLVHGASGHDTVMSFSGAPARTDDGAIEGAVVVFRDVTSMQRVERAKDEFLAVAAHELRSPLAAVRSYADLLLRREQSRNEADPRDLHGLNILTQQVSHMLRMVDNLLDVSRIDAGQLDLQKQRVNLASLANQVIDQQRPAAGTRELILKTAQAELWVECDQLRIRQVITNLLSNAIKYSLPDSEVIITLRTVEWPEQKTERDEYESQVAEGTRTRSLALVAVQDQGSGIPPEQIGNLFRRFFRARSYRAEGLGLGLYLSRQFIEMHGGRIWVESVVGVGSTFSFVLPLR